MSTRFLLLALPTRPALASTRLPPSALIYKHHVHHLAPRKPSERARTDISTSRTSGIASRKSFFSTSSRYAVEEPPRTSPKTSTAEQPLSPTRAGPTGRTVDLKYDLHKPSSSVEEEYEGGTAGVVIAHGLFGSKQNWGSLGKSIAARTGLPVYALDLRNHGASPHVDSLHYQDMAADITHFIKHTVRSEIGNKPVLLIGHSMGGKAVQAVALSPELEPGLLSGMISVDMSPKRGSLSKEFIGYVDAMEEIERAQCSTRKEADEILQRYEQDIGVRQFLLTNLTRSPADAPFWTFRIPLDIIRRHISQLGDFPHGPDDSVSSVVRALFVKGSKSAYINHKNIPLARQFFPSMRLVTLEAGHWVQAEKPREFVDLVHRFVKGESVGEVPEHL
ncbi:hypothetical protein A4X13_0g3418 [Tilletia indica]|uniref:Uncharacterized protein n=1 Tax=Tilletia indica TaxID=43049 RepID=A0A177TNN1_9BASI|nr:hypothetical protein A4X13_0g3418 [Tilletia indica]